MIRLTADRYSLVHSGQALRPYRLNVVLPDGWPGRPGRRYRVRALLGPDGEVSSWSVAWLDALNGQPWTPRWVRSPRLQTLSVTLSEAGFRLWDRINCGLEPFESVSLWLEPVDFRPADLRAR